MDEHKSKLVSEWCEAIAIKIAGEMNRELPGMVKAINYVGLENGQIHFEVEPGKSFGKYLVEATDWSHCRAEGEQYGRGH